MIKVKRIDHVAIATPPSGDPGGSSIAATLSALFGLVAGPTELVREQRVSATFLDAPGAGSAATSLELVCPEAEALDGTVARFVAKRGTALHHVCFEVDDLAAALTTLKNAGVPLVDEVPRRGARGHLVGFVHPKATGGVLFELCQHVAHP
jgi:methylmalonyl-CoA epimerase